MCGQLNVSKGLLVLSTSACFNVQFQCFQRFDFCFPCVSQFEGLPTYPDVSRMWEIVDKYRVTKFYTAPTAIRLLMKYGSEPVQK